MGTPHGQVASTIKGLEADYLAHKLALALAGGVAGGAAALSQIMQKTKQRERSRAPSPQRSSSASPGASASAGVPQARSSASCVDAINPHTNPPRLTVHLHRHLASLR